MWGVLTMIMLLTLQNEVFHFHQPSTSFSVKFVISLLSATTTWIHQIHTSPVFLVNLSCFRSCSGHSYYSSVFACVSDWNRQQIITNQCIITVVSCTAQCLRVFARLWAGVSAVLCPYLHSVQVWTSTGQDHVQLLSTKIWFLGQMCENVWAYLQCSPWFSSPLDDDHIRDAPLIFLSI